MTEESCAHEVLKVLDEVIDPELGIGIVSLGLIYRISVDNRDVDIVMTLTVPGCPMHNTITADVRNTIGRLPWVQRVDVHLTFDPPWSVDRLSDRAKELLGRA